MIRRWLFIALVALAFASCASQPVQEPEPVAQKEPEVQPVPVVEKTPEVKPEPVVEKEPEISKESIQSLYDEVVSLRKEAFDLGLKDIMPKSYPEAENLFLSGKTAKEADVRPKAKNDLEASKAQFIELLTEGTSIVAENWKTKAEDAKKRAINAGSETLSPFALGIAHEAMADAFDAEGDEKRAIVEFKTAASSYDAVARRSTANSVKNKVDSLEYRVMDPGNYDIAENKLRSVDTVLPSDPKAAYDAADEAYLRYRLVLTKGWELTAGKKRTTAEKFKVDAEAIKADVAVKTEYADAKAVWDSAVLASESGDHEKASELFAESEMKFEEVYSKAAAKRKAAEDALKAAKAKTSASAELAREADESGIGAEE